MSDTLKFIAIGDIHISDRHILLTQEALANTLRAVDKIGDADFVVVMGDVFDKHNHLSMTHLKMAVDFIKKLVEKKLTFVLVGNHDRVNNKDFMSDIHPYVGMHDEKGKLYIANTPKVVKIKGKYLLFMPYVAPGRFLEAINYYIEAMHKAGKMMDVRSVEDFHIIFAHQEFKGAPYGPIVSTNGDEWPEHFPMVVSGHIHMRLALQNNLFYTGSLYPITMSESNDKGLVICDYNMNTRKLSTRPVRVVASQKEVRHVSAADPMEMAEMMAMERQNTKYVVSGTADDIAAIRARASGKGLNIVFDVRPVHVETSNESYDDILRTRATDEDVRALLEEIVA